MYLFIVPVVVGNYYLIWDFPPLLHICSHIRAGGSLRVVSSDFGWMEKEKRDLCFSLGFHTEKEEEEET